MMRRAARHLGRRGGILTLFGLAWTLIGVGFAFVPADRFSQPGPGDNVLDALDRTPWPGLFWITCGLAALINGLLRRRFNNEDAVGYAALIMPPTGWVFAYGWSWVLWIVPAYPDGRNTGWLGVLVFGVMVAIIRICATWPDDFDVPEDVSVGSAEKALLDRLIETKPENDARGQRAREDSEQWIQQARLETERHIESSAHENDRMIQAAKDEANGTRDTKPGP